MMGLPEDVQFVFNGLPVVRSSIAYLPARDWSGCRSPSRARRRKAQGHRQRDRLVMVPTVFLVDRTLYAPQEIMRAISAWLEERAANNNRRSTLPGMLGMPLPRIPTPMPAELRAALLNPCTLPLTIGVDLASI